MPQNSKYLIPNWPAPSNVFALTTLRGTELADLDLPADPLWIKQVHGVEVVQPEQTLYSSATLPVADAMLTSQANTPCLIRTADCLPVFICDLQGQQVAAIHAGWRSLSAGIIANTCKRFVAPLESCIAWLGPAIGAKAFEVGKDVLDDFTVRGWTPAQLELGFAPKSPDKWLGDLYTLARLTLQQQGIPADHIYGGEWCTHSDPARFYSYRRSKDAGRMLNIIWRT